MNENDIRDALISLQTLVSALVAAVIALAVPLVSGWVDRRTTRNHARAALVAEGRQLVEVLSQAPFEVGSLPGQPLYRRLRPHLDAEVIKSIEKPGVLTVRSTTTRETYTGPASSVVRIPAGGHLHPDLERLLDGLARLEAKWGLL